MMGQIFISNRKKKYSVRFSLSLSLVLRYKRDKLGREYISRMRNSLELHDTLRNLYPRKKYSLVFGNFPFPSKSLKRATQKIYEDKQFLGLQAGRQAGRHARRGLVVKLHAANV